MTPPEKLTVVVRPEPDIKVVVTLPDVVTFFEDPILSFAQNAFTSSIAYAVQVYSGGDTTGTGNYSGSFTGSVIIDSLPPNSSNDTGSAGEVRYDHNYVYVCISHNTWKRAQLSNW